MCANEQGFGSATKRKSSLSVNSRLWHYFRCSAQSPQTQRGLAHNPALMALRSWSLLFLSAPSLVLTPRKTPYGFLQSSGVRRRLLRRRQARRCLGGLQAAAGPHLGHTPGRACAPQRRSGLAQGSSSTSAWEFLSVQKFCFSNVKCIRATLNPGLSPMSHDITVPTWPVKTLALSREIYGYETKWVL